VFVPIDEGNDIRHLDLVSSLEKPRNSLGVTGASRIRLSREPTRVVEQNLQKFTDRIESRVL
jgi:hypothetical protein